MQYYRLAEEKELDLTELQKMLTKHYKEVNKRLRPLLNAYTTRYDIFRQPKKPDWKPDNRIGVNFAKYIVDTMNGFFIGNPIKVVCDDKRIAERIEFFDNYNDQDDNNAELSKLCDIFGRGYEMYYNDEDAQIGITYVSPIEGFMIYDDSVLERERYFVRVYIDEDKKMHGSVSDDTSVRHFDRNPELRWTDEWTPHNFDGVPATEYKENEERMGIFEPVMSEINAYNKALSEKANDVDYFSDAYLKILGAKVSQNDLNNIRTNKIINFSGQDASGLVVEFLGKPEGDTTQEHLLDRLERLIFQISMVANISDENFGVSSGIALKYKLQAMSNLAKTKERKFTSGMNRRYKLICSNPASGLQADDWVKLQYQFTPNFPANIQEEAQIAGELAGIVSKRTQLKVLSVVDNVDAELQAIEEDKDKESYKTDYPVNRTKEADNGLQEEEKGQEEKIGE